MQFASFGAFALASIVYYGFLKLLVLTNVLLKHYSTFEEHHNMIFGILWEMVVDSTAELKINAAKLLKTIVSFSTTRAHFHFFSQFVLRSFVIYLCNRFHISTQKLLLPMFYQP